MKVFAFVNEVETNGILSEHSTTDNTPDGTKPIRGVAYQYLSYELLRRWSRRRGRRSLIRSRCCRSRILVCRRRSRSGVLVRRSGRRGSGVICRRGSRIRAVLIARDEKSRGRKRGKYFQRLHLVTPMQAKFKCRIPDWSLLSNGDFSQTQRSNHQFT